MGCGVETEANDLITQLTAGESFELPKVNLEDPLLKIPTALNDLMYQKVKAPTIEEVTSGVVGGSGVFDRLMATINAHLADEYQKNRITGAEYSKTYIALTQSALASAIQFTLGQAQAFWQAQNAQIAAVTGRVNLEQVKLQTAQAQFDALQAKTNYALAKSKLATESMQYCITKFNYDKMLPEQLALAVRENAGKEIANQSAQYSLNYILPQQQGVVLNQRIGLELKNAVDTYTKDYLLPMQYNLVTEQANTARAQTLDNRISGEAVSGVLGQQKALYGQQVTSYRQDAIVKGTKMFTDAWSVQKTIDEGLQPPANFTNVALDQVLSTARVQLGLG